MKQYNVWLKEMKCKLCFRVEAENKKEAIKKVEEQGFNCGKEQGGDYFGDFEVNNILPVEKENYFNLDKLKGGKNGIKCE